MQLWFFFQFRALINTWLQQLPVSWVRPVWGGGRHAGSPAVWCLVALPFHWTAPHSQTDTQAPDRKCSPLTGDLAESTGARRNLSPATRIWRHQELSILFSQSGLCSSDDTAEIDFFAVRSPRFWSAVTAQGDEFNGSFHSSYSRLLNVKT